MNASRLFTTLSTIALLTGCEIVPLSDPVEPAPLPEFVDGVLDEDVADGLVQNGIILSGVDVPTEVIRDFETQRLVFEGIEFFDGCPDQNYNRFNFRIRDLDETIVGETPNFDQVETIEVYAVEPGSGEDTTFTSVMRADRENTALYPRFFSDYSVRQEYVAVPTRGRLFDTDRFTFVAYDSDDRVLANTQIRGPGEADAPPFTAELLDDADGVGDLRLLDLRRTTRDEAVPFWVLPVRIQNARVGFSPFGLTNVSGDLSRVVELRRADPDLAFAGRVWSNTLNERDAWLVVEARENDVSRFSGRSETVTFNSHFRDNVCVGQFPRLDPVRIPVRFPIDTGSDGGGSGREDPPGGSDGGDGSGGMPSPPVEGVSWTFSCDCRGGMPVTGELTRLSVSYCANRIGTPSETSVCTLYRDSRSDDLSFCQPNLRFTPVRTEDVCSPIGSFE
ncbi:MAG: hypothetical protein AAFV54_06425 [Pseudomonadota bacterium]